MIQLVPVKDVNSEELNNGSPNSMKSCATEQQRNGQCTVHIELPKELDDPLPNKEPGGIKKSPSIGNFSSKRTSMNVQWKNISLTTKKGKIILKELSGAVYSGELTAIMGPSGAGKSSLLNVLSGFGRQKVTGQILVNGVNREMRGLRKLNCYIMQDDHILPRLTVREIVSIAANLKIPSTVQKEEKHNAVNNCLQCLGLISVQNQKADELSGGQRKRLCIAQELVSNPPLIFLDEPTSGLDSSSCLQLIQLLKCLAEEGRTVVCTIHQPSSKIYEIFDKLYMLADGQCIYRGCAKNLISFLSAQGLNCPKYHNPADYVTEVAMGDYGDWNSRLKNAIDAADDVSVNSSRLEIRASESLQELSVQSSTLSLLQTKREDKPPDTEEPIDGYATSYSNQFRVLFHRHLLCTIRDRANIKIKLLGNTILGLLLGMMYYGIGNDATKVHSNSVLIFVTVTFLVVCAQIPTIITFPMKRIVFEREQMNYWYSTRMYYLATIAAEIPFQLLYPIVSATILYWMTDQPNDINRYGLFLVTAIVITLIGESVGQLIGAAFDIQNGVFISSVSSVHTLLFCGFFITINNMPAYLRWLPYSSFGRYALRNVLLIIYSMDRPPLYCHEAPCLYQDPTAILKHLEMEGDLYVDYSILIGFFLIFRIITYLVLKFRIHRMK